MTYEEFREAHANLSPRQKEWVSHKCRWERMSRWAVMDGWEVPSDDQLHEDGTHKGRQQP